MKVNNKQFHKILFILILQIAYFLPLFGGTTTKKSAPFSMDTRENNPVPVDGWQVLSNQGNTYNEDFVIDDLGKTWCFYYSSPGANQPVYLKIFKPDGYLYKYRMTVGHGSSSTNENYNSIRAAVNDSTGDVWVAVQGNEGGYFVIYDSTGNVKQDSTVLDYNSYLPKIASGKNGKMWFSWHTNLDVPQESNARIACYNIDADNILGPLNVSTQNGVINTDVAEDDSGHVWVTYDISYGGFESRFSIFDNELNTLVDGAFISDTENTLNPQRTMFPDNLNKRMWILEKNIPSSNHHLHLFDLSGTMINSVTNVGECGFTRNENNQIEVIRFNSGDILNKIYEYALFQPMTGEASTTWETMYDSTYQFVKNNIAYNPDFGTLKVYAVNKEQNLTKIKFLNVAQPSPVIVVDPMSIDFDTTKIKASYQKQRTITIQNTGASILNVYDIYSNDSHFTVSETSFSLSPFNSKNVTVEFAPTSTDTIRGIVEILSNDPNNSLVEVVVSGRGYEPTTAKIVVSPPVLLFDDVAVGTSQDLSIYINNMDDYEPLQIHSITTSDTQFTVNKSEFTVRPGSGEPGEWVIVTFSPTIVSPLIEDTLVIHNNDPDTTTFLVPLYATSHEADKPSIAVEPDSLYFGEVSVDGQKTMTFRTYNQGEADLIVSGISSNHSWFTVNPTEFTVVAGESQTVEVTFNPLDNVTANAQLTIFNNDPENSELILPVTGTGALLSDPYLVYDQTELFFGSVQVGDTLRKDILMQNYGDRTLEIVNIYTTNEYFKVSGDTIRIYNNESYSLPVYYIPGDTLSHDGALQFNSNDPNNDFVSISLYGKGKENYQHIIVFPETWNYDSVLVNSTSSKIIQIGNEGYRTLNITNIFSNNDNFYSNITSFTLPVNDTRDVYVTFSPDSINHLFEGEISIISDDPVADSVVVTVSGYGRDSTDQKIDLSSDELDFGIVPKENTQYRTLNIHNYGERKLNITNIISTDTTFYVNNKNFQVLGNSFKPITVFFTPYEVRQYSATLKVVSDDPEQDTVTVQLSGRGRFSLPQKIELSDTTLNYGTQPMGRTAVKTLWIDNRGERDLTISQISVSDAQFTVSHSWFVLNPFHREDLLVYFTPTQLGAINEELTLVTNDPDRDTIRVALTANVEVYSGPEISIYPGTAIFPNTLPGVSRTMSFWVLNRSNTSELVLSDYLLNHEAFQVTYMPQSIARLDSGIIRVKFTPPYQGYFNTTLTIYSNDSYNYEYPLNLHGFGITENVGQNTLEQWGWYPNNSAPFGDGYAGMVNNYTDNVLTGEEDQAWFIKDITLSEYPEPGTALMNLSYKNGVTVVINNTFVYDDTSASLEYWNTQDLDVSDYLTLGRNRIAITILTLNNQPNGGFDCELNINGQPYIRRGDQNWGHDDALWWYFYSPGSRPSADTLQNRLWFSRDYALTGIDSVTADWVFENNGSDTLYDNTPYGRRAILGNGVSWTDGLIGQAMWFKGETGSYVELETNLNSMPQTIEMWFNCFEANGQRQNLISNRGDNDYGQGVFLDENLNLGIYYYNGEYVFTDFPFIINTWYNISVQYNFVSANSTYVVEVFVNGESIGTFQYNYNYPSGSGSRCYLGSNPLAGGNFTFNGAIDDLKIKNKVAGTIQELDIANMLFGRDQIISVENTDISFYIDPSPFKILSGTFRYFKGGSSEQGTDFVEDTNFWNPDSTYESPLVLTIPFNYVDIQGVNFSLELKTNYGTVYYPETGPGEYGYDFIQFATYGEASSLTLGERVYQQVSVPYSLVNEDIDSVLVDDLDPYDPHYWRLFDWNQLDTNYVEYKDSTWDNGKSFSRGKSYWLITDRPKQWDAGSGQTPDEDEFLITLTPGWNMIANPYPYTILWSNIIKSDEEVISDLYHYSVFDSIGWLHGSSVLTMLPWRGYFIENKDSVNQSLIIPGNEFFDYPMMKNKSIKEIYQAKYPGTRMLITAEVKCGKYFDTNNLYGVSDRAKQGYDKYDSREVPAIGDYVSLSVNNHNWANKKGNYTIDFQKSGAAGYSWEIVLDYSLNEPAAVLNLDFKQVFNVPDNWQIFLFDLSEDVAYNLKDNSSIKVATENKTNMRKSYMLVIGTEEYVKGNSNDIPLIPMEFSLHQNYPNPFNSSTTILFSLPKRMKSKVQIYNIMGQLVRTLVDEELRGGMHQIIWNGKNNNENILSTGMYFIRIEAENQTDVKKMLLIK
ncbi:hypothetical protein B6I21_01680 [candidate division KSB1 bacterium 4572_119]|nr:MAG: hypothetical protein B6I21_01680 [candidate division KSB1 bacterium 4572_119]